MAGATILVGVNKMIDVEKRMNESDERYEVREIDDYYQVYDDG